MQGLRQIFSKVISIVPLWVRALTFSEFQKAKAPPTLPLKDQGGLCGEVLCGPSPWPARLCGDNRIEGAAHISLSHIRSLISSYPFCLPQTLCKAVTRIPCAACCIVLDSVGSILINPYLFRAGCE